MIGQREDEFKKRCSSLLEEGGEEEATRGEAAEERVGERGREALQGAALPAPGLHSGGAARCRIDAAVHKPRPAAGAGDGGGGRHGRCRSGRLSRYRREEEMDAIQNGKSRRRSSRTSDRGVGGGVLSWAAVREIWA